MKKIELPDRIMMLFQYKMFIGRRTKNFRVYDCTVSTGKP